MNHIADRFVAILDTNVLFSFRKRDILMRFYQMGLYRARWSEHIFKELLEVTRDKRPHLVTNVENFIENMRSNFGEAFVTDFELLINSIELPDEKDRHVLAAAIICGAQLIVTDNINDFPNSYISKYSISAITPDEFLYLTHRLYPAPSLLALKNLRESYKNPHLV